MVNNSVLLKPFELINDRPQAVASCLSAILIIDVLQYLFEKIVLRDIIQYISFVVQRNPSLERIKYVFMIYLCVLESWDAVIVEQLQDINLLSIKSLPGSLSLKLIHNKFVIINFRSDIFQRFEVNVEQPNILSLVRNEDAYITFDRSKLQGQ